jgi:hypothetical protein
VSTLIFMWLVTYPACGDALWEKYPLGSFTSMDACERVLEEFNFRWGPPEPGSVRKCAPDRR